MSGPMRVLRGLIAVSLAVSTVGFVAWSWRWPLVGDASLMHYIAFLIEHGMAPYRDLGDMNMPGAFLTEMAGMKVFGGGAVGWRVFDFALLAAAFIGFRVVTRRAGWFAAIFAGALFALVHGRDGLAQGGQRDLTMAVLLMGSTALLFVGVRRRAWWAVAGFGLLAGLVLTIKPTTLPLSVAQLGIAAWVMRRPDASPRVLHPVWTVGWAGLGMVVGPAVAVGFLVQQRAVGAFWAGLRTIVPYYATLGHRTLGYLVLHSVSPLLALVVLWFGVLALARPRVDWERGMLLCGVVFGLASYVVQARALPYHRYPLLAFLLAAMAVDFTEAMERTSGLQMRAAAVLAAVALAVGGLWLGPQSAAIVHRCRWWQTEFTTTLGENLERLGGAQLSGRVQCIDWVSGCGTTLYAMRLMPATGVMADFLLFGPAEVPAVAETRKSFREAVERRPPRVIVVSSWLHFDGPGEYRKLDMWPEFAAWLAVRYRLEMEWTPTRTERWWSREELPAGYRIYVLKD